MPGIRFALLLVLILGSVACSVKRFAINELGDSLAASGTTFASDEDPELVAAAVPVSLRLIESLLAESPRHRGLLFAAASGFTQYSYAFVQQDSEVLEERDVARADALRTRARKFDNGLRGLETKHPGFGAALRSEAKSAAAAATKKDVPLLYWTAAAWGAATTPKS
jgi:hypothetical protein